MKPLKRQLLSGITKPIPTRLYAITEFIKMALGKGQFSIVNLKSKE